MGRGLCKQGRFATLAGLDERLDFSSTSLKIVSNPKTLACGAGPTLCFFIP